MANDKRVLITGAAAGIGRASAQAFLDAGWFVGAFDVDELGVRAWADAVSADRACAGRLDVTDSHQWHSAIAKFEAAAGGLDVLVNNAGVLVDGAFETQAPEAHRRIVEVNVTGTMNGCHAAKAALTASGGRVINMSSASALFGQPYLASYSASKFAVRGLTEALHVEWAPAGVKVCDVMPLFVRTAMVNEMTAVPALQRLGVKLTPADVARVILRAATARRPRIHYTVGPRTAAMKLMLRLSPDRIAAAVNASIGR
ncbi:short chain dehydrogenase [Salinisphaera dokdonensis CL-ES53]|uniref:Short chain dehydrogenase n=1 Tax=Salinisphaera dokdonensis CL-ES53 TaxID=1304272 RepID=A0ABV2B0U5_9GAMM